MAPYIKPQKRNLPIPQTPSSREKCTFQAETAKETVQVLPEGAGREIWYKQLKDAAAYELKIKDISKASIQTVLALSNVWDCRVEDIIKFLILISSGETFRYVPPLLSHARLSALRFYAYRF